jgi:protoporphyrinogen oxidase
VYTQKYWTVSPRYLTTDWVGERVFYPNVLDVEKGYFNKQDRNTHYITKFRYPNNGGYFSYAQPMTEGMRVQYGKELERISFQTKELFFTDGSCHVYERLISTIPLPILIDKSEAPTHVKDAADQLSCSSLLLVNVVVNHTQDRPDHWMYVYDQDKYSTRISFLEKLSSANAGASHSAIQVEVYFSKYKPLTESIEQIAEQVKGELIEMGLVHSESSFLSMHTRWVPWANVIFDSNRRPALEIIFNWLQKVGYNRIEDELEPMTNWTQREEQAVGSLMLAGRFAEWKYYWTDDCIITTKEKVKQWQ